MEATRFYYLYNYSVQPELLFRNDENYRFFLKKYEQYIGPVATTHALCLLPNQFHLLVEIKPVEMLLHFKTEHTLEKRKLYSTKIIKQQFSNLFNSYAQAYNKQHNRKGSLFQKNYKIQEAETHADILITKEFIFHQPVDNQFTNNPQNWKWSEIADADLIYRRTNS